MIFQLLIKTLKLWFFANWTIHISNLNFNWLYLLERQYFIYSSLFKVLSSNLKNLCDSFIIFLFLIERLIYIYIYIYFILLCVMTMKTIEIYKELELQKEENCPIECKKLKRTCPNGLRHKPSNKLQEIVHVMI